MAEQLSIYTERTKRFFTEYRLGALIGAAALLPISAFALWQDSGLFNTIFILDRYAPGVFGVLLNIIAGATIGALIHRVVEKIRRS